MGCNNACVCEGIHGCAWVFVRMGVRGGEAVPRAAVVGGK